MNKKTIIIETEYFLLEKIEEDEIIKEHYKFSLKFPKRAYGNSYNAFYGRVVSIAGLKKLSSELEKFLHNSDGER